MIVALDAGPLGLATNPRGTHASLRCNQWLTDLLAQGARVVIPEIADYEVRRELLRAGRSRGLRHLDQMNASLRYLPITTEAMLLAADFWAQARRTGQPTSPDLALDADVILAAQATLLEQSEHDTVIIATTNVRHLARFATAQLWHDVVTSAP